MLKLFSNIILFIVLFFSIQYSNAQTPKYYKNNINVDSLIVNCSNPVILMKQVYVAPQPTFKNKAEERRYNRLVRNFKRVYPYAKLMASTMEDVEKNLANISGKRDKRKYIRKREKEFRRVYEKELRGLTMSQGLLLVKLLDRETGSTSFDIIKEFRGGLLAGTFQGIARLFGNDLKAKYDPKGEDKNIEFLVLQYENGQLF